MQRAQQLQPAREHGALGVGLGLGLELELGLPSSCSRPASTVRWRASASRMPSPDGAASLMTHTEEGEVKEGEVGEGAVASSQMGSRRGHD